MKSKEVSKKSRVRFELGTDPFRHEQIPADETIQEGETEIRGRGVLRLPLIIQGEAGSAPALFVEIPGRLEVEAPVEEKLLKEIDASLREVKRLSAEAHAHDEEMARLREETRSLIDEMLRDLNLKAA